MTASKTIAIINEIERLKKEVAELREARKNALLGAASASVSAGGGSKSYSNWSAKTFDDAISNDLNQITRLRRALSGKAQIGIKSIAITRG